MLGYRITINNDPKGKFTWSLLFDSESSECDAAVFDHVSSTTREFVGRLSALQPKRMEQQEA